jgi:hypothetical protein
MKIITLEEEEGCHDGHRHSSHKASMRGYGKDMGEYI